MRPLAYLAQQDLAVGHLLAVLLVTADELGDEAGHGWDRADHRRLGAVGRIALEPGGEGVATLELEPPQRRVAVEEDVVGEHVADIGGAEDVGEAFAQFLCGGVVEDGRLEWRSCRALLVVIAPMRPYEASRHRRIGRSTESRRRAYR